MVTTIHGSVRGMITLLLLEGPSMPLSCPSFLYRINLLFNFGSGFFDRYRPRLKDKSVSSS